MYESAPPPSICTRTHARTRAHADSRLYVDYKSRFYFWRLVLLGRKFCLVLVAILFSGNPMFQASLALSVMIIAYGLHVKFLPFLEPSDGDTGEKPNAAAAALTRVGSGMRRQVARAGRRATITDVARLAGAGIVNETRRQIFHLNVLESTMLRSSIAVLLCGMVFQSGEVLETGPWYAVLAVFVGTVLIGSTALFVGLVAVETAKVCTAAGKLAGLRRLLRRFSLRPGQHTLEAELQQADLNLAKAWTSNPMAAAMRRRVGMLGSLSSLPVKIGPSGETINPLCGDGGGEAKSSAAATEIERLRAEVARLLGQASAGAENVAGDGAVPPAPSGASADEVPAAGLPTVGLPAERA